MSLTMLSKLENKLSGHQSCDSCGNTDLEKLAIDLNSYYITCMNCGNKYKQ